MPGHRGHRPRHARPSIARRIATRVAVPATVTTVLVAGVGLAAWADQSASVAETAAGNAPGRAPESTLDSARRSDRPNRDATRSPLPTGSPTGSVPAAKQKHAPKRSSAALAPKLSTTIGTRYLRSSLRLRVGPGSSYSASGRLKTDSKVAITAVNRGGWTQIAYHDAPRWVPTTQLRRTSATATGAGATVRTGTACPSGSAVEHGLTPDAIKVHRAICAAFPQVKSYGGVRADSLPEHPSGRALDAMISDSRVGWRIATWVRSHAKDLGVSQVIYSRKIWTVQRSSEGWRSMSDRGSATANHEDHVHVTVYGNAAG